MPSVDEAITSQRGEQAALDAGLNALSGKQEVQFRRYDKFALASDGFVFWVATPEVQTITGALHYSTDRIQDEDQTIATNFVLLNSQSEITSFNEIAPTSMWLGSWPIGGGGTLTIAFARHTQLFREANIWHYTGFAVFPSMQAQILDDPSRLPAGPVVSNSTPIWLSFTQFMGQTVPVYPSFLVPDNVVPPYVVAHVDPERTIALQSAMLIGSWPGTVQPNTGTDPLHNLAGSQLMRDFVRLTLKGFDNAMAQQYLFGLVQASIDETLPFGFANVPAVCDAKRTQVEIAALMPVKQIEIEANYYQGAANVVAYRLLLEAAVSSWTFLGGNGLFGIGGTTQDAQNVNGEGTVFE